MSKQNEILEAAVVVALERGLRHTTRDHVAAQAGVSSALINRYWGTHGALMDKVVSEAIHREHLALIAQALLEKHPHALAAPRALRQRAALTIAG